MSTPSLSRLTMETMANYRVAAAQVVAASSAGSRRLVRAADGTVRSQIVARASRLAPQAGERFDEVRGSVRRLVDRGIDQVEKAAELTIERGSHFATAQVARLADFAADIEAPVFAEGLHTAARLSIPAAQLALLVSSKVAEGATSLADRAGARAARRTVRKGKKAAHQAAGHAARGGKAKVKTAKTAVAQAARATRAARAARSRVA